MTFNVSAADIYAYGALVGRAKTDFEAGTTFLKEAANFRTDGLGDDVIWGKVVSLHKTVSGQAESAFGRYTSVLGSSEEELMRSGGYYETTDREEAAKVDAAYPGGAGRVPPPSATAGAEGFADREVARDTLAKDEGGFFQDRWDGLVGDRGTALNDHIQRGKVLAAIGDGVGMVLDFTSPSTLVNEGIKLVFNYDVLDELTQCVAGDWGNFAGMQGAWAQLAEFAGAVSANVSGGMETLTVTWEGKAAASAYQYFDGLAKKLDSLADSMVELSGIYADIADDIVAFINSLKAGVTLLLDLAIGIALKAAAGGIAAATGVGLVVTGASAASIAYDIVRMLSRYEKILAGLTILFHTLNMAENMGHGKLEQQLAEINSFPVPASTGGYDHARV